MRVQYSFPGSIEIGLEIRDLESMQSKGFTVDRAGFSGFDSKVWVFLPAVKSDASAPIIHKAQIEDGGDLRVHLSRGFLLPLVIEQSSIHAPEGHVEHFLGETGTIHLKFAS